MVAGLRAPGGENTRKLMSSLSLRCDSKVALIFGGTGAIGESLVFALLKSGARVVVASRNQATASPRLQEEMRTNDALYFVSCDIANYDDVQRLAARLRDQSLFVDYLVLANGIQIRKSFVSLEKEEWERLLAINLSGVFYACKTFAPGMMEKRSGRIIGITSLTSFIGIEHIGAYAASKGGMMQFLQTAAIELAPYNITVNMIAPGRIKTPMNAQLLDNPEIARGNLSRIPLNRFGSCDDLSGALMFLCSDASAYMTGQTLTIDGGWLASGGNPRD